MFSSPDEDVVSGRPIFSGDSLVLDVATLRLALIALPAYVLSGFLSGLSDKTKIEIRAK